MFWIFSAHGKMAWGGPKWGPRGCVPTNPDLANILGRTDLDFENFYFFELLDPIFLDFQVPRSPNSQIFRFPDFQTPPPAPAPDELSDPNLTPLPTHPGIKYVTRSPCCDHTGSCCAPFARSLSLPKLHPSCSSHESG